MDLWRLLPKSLRPARRSPLRQREVDDETARMALYHSPICSYLLGVRRIIKHPDLDIELRGVKRQIAWHDDLRRENGSGQVPCLQIRHADRTE